MFKTDEELNQLLDHSNNGSSVKIIGIGQDDRSDRTPNSHRSKRSLTEKIDIALLASVVGINGAAELIGTTPGVVSRIASGENSQGKPSADLEFGIAGKKKELIDKALDKAQIFLDLVSPMDDSKIAFQKMHTAEKAVSIYERLTPKTPQVQNNTQVIFYAPKTRESNDYPVIEVHAKD